MKERRILLLNTGGTLSSVEGGKGLKPGLGREDILEDLVVVAKGFTLEYEELYSLDSANITPAHWKGMAERIGQVYRQYEGIVVIHGTDTMAYTASMLSFMLRGIPIPVVITGSQLSISNPVADALENLRAAIFMAASGQTGVFVAFNRKIILGTRASKVSTKSFDAFESINFPYAATINAYGMTMNREVLPKPRLDFGVDSGCSENVMLIKLFPGMSPEILRYLPKMGIKGVVIEAFGLGGMPFKGQDNLCDIVKELSDQGMAVVIGSQCRYDGSSLSVYETGKLALENGAIQMYDMTTEAAVTKLMWLLEKNLDQRELRMWFNTNLVNEITVQDN